MMKLSSRLLLLSLLTTTAAQAQTNWTGAGADNNWSTSGNWSAGTPISTSSVTFGDTDKTSSSTINNVVDTDFSISRLTYNNTGTNSTDWQVTEIASGKTLSVTANTNVNALLIGGVTAVTTSVKITGGGTLTIDGGAATLADLNLIGTTTSGAWALPTLDLSGLNQFNARVDQFILGGTTIAHGHLTLAQNSNVTANAIIIGAGNKTNTAGSGGTSTLRLGTSNTIKADSITIGRNDTRADGTLNFAGTGSSVVIRNTAGTGRVTSFILGGGPDGNQGSIDSIADFTGTGNSVDALITDLRIANTSTGNTTHNSTLSMSAGTIDATNVFLSRRTSATGTGTGVGTVNVSGGTLKAGTMLMASVEGTAASATANLNISGTGTVEVGTPIAGANLVTGQVTTGTKTATSNINLNGGTLTVYGNIAEGTNAGGTITSSITINGGTLDVKGNSIAVDTFNAQSGSIQNLGQLNGGGVLTKTTAGTLTLAGTNSYTGGTTVTAGTLAGAASALTGNITNNAAVDITGGGSYSGAIGGTGTLTKSGSGNATLSGTHTYSGSTSVTGGTLTIAGTGSINSSSGINVGGGATFVYNSSTTLSTALNLSSGATLKGSGDLGTTAVNVAGGVTLSPGNSPGALNTGSETWAGGGTYVWEINKANGSEGGPNGWDVVNINGNLSITATSLSKFTIDITGLEPGNAPGLVDSFNNLQNYTWTIANVTGSVTGFDPAVFTLLTGAFTNNNDLGGGSFSIVQNGGDINLQFNAVPEPATWWLVGLAGMVLVLRRRRGDFQLR